MRFQKKKNTIAIIRQLKLWQKIYDTEKQHFFRHVLGEMKKIKSRKSLTETQKEPNPETTCANLKKAREQQKPSNEMKEGSHVVA